MARKLALARLAASAAAAFAPPRRAPCASWRRRPRRTGAAVRNRARPDGQQRNHHERDVEHVADRRDARIEFVEHYVQPEHANQFAVAVTDGCSDAQVAVTVGVRPRLRIRVFHSIAECGLVDRVPHLVQRHDRFGGRIVTRNPVQGRTVEYPVDPAVAIYARVDVDDVARARCMRTSGASACRCSGLPCCAGDTRVLSRSPSICAAVTRASCSCSVRTASTCASCACKYMMARPTAETANVHMPASSASRSGWIFRRRFDSTDIDAGWRTCDGMSLRNVTADGLARASP